MAFVILSTGPITGSRLHTLRMRTLLLALGGLVLTALAGGLSLGYRYGQGDATGLPSAATLPLPSLTQYLEQPEGRALIERIGTLSVRVIQLETEAEALAMRVGIPPGTGPENGWHATASQPPAGGLDHAGTAEDSSEPSGGPWLPAAETFEPAVRTEQEYDLRFAAIERRLEAVNMRLDGVATATRPRQLERMAYPDRLPIAGRPITSGFGVRRDPFTRRLARHTGLDISAPRNTPIQAAGGGRVTFAGYRPAYGNTVEIEHGDGLKTRYAHASRLLVRRGEVVLPGQEIARVGSTGRSTGAHLHFEVLRNGKPVEPRSFVLPTGT